MKVFLSLQEIYSTLFFHNNLIQIREEKIYNTLFMFNNKENWKIFFWLPARRAMAKIALSSYFLVCAYFPYSLVSFVCEEKSFIYENEKVMEERTTWNQSHEIWLNEISNYLSFDFITPILLNFADL